MGILSNVKYNVIPVHGLLDCNYQSYGWLKKAIIFVLVSAFQSCSPKKPLGNNYFITGSGDEIVYLYDNNSSPGAPDVPWDDKYRTVNADVKTFVPLLGDYAKDRYHYYYKGIILRNLDYPTFQISDYKEDRMIVSGIAKDKHHVYSFRDPQNIIEGASPETYHKTNIMVGNKYWHTDDKHFFINDTIVEVDYGTFKPITEYIYYDKNNIYYLHSPEYSDKATYLMAIPESGLTDPKEVAPGIIESKAAVFITPKEGQFIKLPVEDRHSIRYFPPDYTYMIIDRKIYCKGELLTDAEIASFSVFKYPGSNAYSSFAKDDFHVYYYDDKLADADPKTVRFVKDGNQDLLRDDYYKWVPQHGSINHFTRKMPIEK